MKEKNKGTPLWKALLFERRLPWRYKERLKPIYYIFYIFSKEYSKIKKYKNKYKGKRCFVIGNGPSLNKTPMNLLKQEYTFAVNSFLPNGAKRFGFVPSFFCVSDGKALPNIKEIPKKTLFFFNKFMKGVNKSSENYFPLDYDYWTNHSKYPFWPYSNIVNGASVITDVCIPLAIFMGFKEIYLVGCDCSLKKGNHFDGSGYKNKNYNPILYGWSDVINAYKILKEFVDKKGIIIKNATVDGELEVFERVKLKELF